MKEKDIRRSEAFRGKIRCTFVIHPEMQMDMKRPRVSRRASLAADGAHRNLRLKNSECDQFIRFNDFTSFNIHIIILESVVFFRIVKFIFLNLITLEKEVWNLQEDSENEGDAANDSER